jgi:hypothetical protein
LNPQIIDELMFKFNESWLQNVRGLIERISDYITEEMEGTSIADDSNNIEDVISDYIGDHVEPELMNIILRTVELRVELRLIEKG